MFSKVFCYYEKEDLEQIQKLLDKEKKSCKVVCDNEQAKEFLKNFNHEIKLIDEFFAVYSNETFEIYEKVKKILLDYQRVCKEITLFEKKIDIGLLHFLQTDTLFIEKIKRILEKKESVIFVFKRINHKHFVIQNIAKKMNYENDEIVNLIKNGQISEYKASDPIENLEKSNKMLKYKNSFSLYSNNVIKSKKNKFSSMLKLSKKILPMLFRILTSRIYEINPDKAIEIILNGVGKKIKNGSTQYGFFLSSSREDLLEPYYSIFQKLNDSMIPFKIFTIDSVTSSFLEKYQYKVLDFFQETFVLENILKKTTKGKIFEQQLEQIAKSNNLVLLHYEKFNSELLDGIYRTIATTLILENICKKVCLRKAMFIEGTSMGMIISQISERIGFSTLSIETLIVDRNAISSLLYKAEKICIYGMQGKQVLRDFGISDDRIEITGNPKYDYIKSYDIDKSKRILEREHSIDSEKKIIVIAMSRWHENDELWMSDLIKFANTKGFEVVIKLHPRYKTFTQENEEKIKIIKKECVGKRFHFTFDIELNLLLSASDIVISDYSNVGIEAVLLEKTVINVNFNKENLENAQNYHKFSAVLYTEKYDELEKMIKEILNENKYKVELEKGRKELINRYNFYNDGKSFERIFNILISNT